MTGIVASKRRHAFVIHLGQDAVVPTAIDNPNYQGPFGNTLLHGAVLSNDRKEVERLLSAGADPRIANREGRSPLQVAQLLGYAELYRLLDRHSGVT